MAPRRPSDASARISAPDDRRLVPLLDNPRAHVHSASAFLRGGRRSRGERGRESMASAAVSRPASRPRSADDESAALSPSIATGTVEPGFEARGDTHHGPFQIALPVWCGSHSWCGGSSLAAASPRAMLIACGRSRQRKTEPPLAATCVSYLLSKKPADGFPTRRLAIETCA